MGVFLERSVRMFFIIQIAIVYVASYLPESEGFLYSGAEKNLNLDFLTWLKLSFRVQRNAPDNRERGIQNIVFQVFKCDFVFLKLECSLCD